MSDLLSEVMMKVFEGGVVIVYFNIEMVLAYNVDFQDEPEYL